MTNGALFFTPAGRATLIGSLPLTDYDQALELILAHTPEIPLWPQLPANPGEGGMLRQFSENLPGYREMADGRTFFATDAADFAEQQLAFFEAYLAAAENPDLLAEAIFAGSPERLPGLYRLRERLTSAPPPELAAVKGQITGPFTLLTGLKDQNSQDAWYDPALHEIVVKGLALKAAWQTRMLAAGKVPVLLFLDEPALAGLGSSAYITVSPEEIASDLNEVLAAVKGAGGLAGIHVCANTDWNLLLSLDLDILSFDAYGFFDRLAACHQALAAFLAKGGIIAWGLIPTAREEEIMAANADGLAALWEQQADALAAGTGRNRPALLRQTLITPSCGTGSLSREAAGRVLELTGRVSAILRSRYGNNP